MRLSLQRSLTPLLSPLAVAALATLLIACQKPQSGDDRLGVVVTVYPIEYFATRVGGERIRVTNLVRPGVEPHDFEPTAEDLKAVAGARVVIYNGLGLEPWIDRVLKSAKGEALISVAAGKAVPESSLRVGTDEDGDIGADPHVWLDPRHAAGQVEAIRDALREADPQHAGEYDRNAQSLTADLNALDRGFAESLGKCRFQHFVTAHEAFGYLADRYSLRQIGVTGISQAEPDPTQLARIVDAVRASGVKVVLTEPGASPRIAETLAREVGAEVMELDPIEFMPRVGDYLSAMEGNLKVLRKALDCNG